MPRIQDVQPLEDFASDLCILLNKLINSRMTYRHFLKHIKKARKIRKLSNLIVLHHRENNNHLL